MTTIEPQRPIPRAQPTDEADGYAVLSDTLPPDEPGALVAQGTGWRRIAGASSPAKVVPRSTAPTGRGGAGANSLRRHFDRPNRARERSRGSGLALGAQRRWDPEEAKRELTRRSAYVREVAHKLDLDPDRPVTPVPEVTDPDVEVVELKTFVEDRAHVRILYDHERKQYLYQVIEPPLERHEEELLAFLKDTLVRTLDGRHNVRDDAALQDYLTTRIDEAILDNRLLVDEVTHQRLRYHLLRDFLGFGPIDVLMHDPLLEDISCDGPSIPIYVFHREYESMRTNLVFEEEDDLDAYVVRLAQRCGKHISLAEPLLDATLPDTSRLQASLSREVTTRGSSFTIRKFRADPLTPPDLVRLGTISPEMGGFYWLAMEEGASMIYGGGTASGKTTTLNAVSQFIPPARKIVSIEDTREINLDHENWIAGLTRPAFKEEQGAGIDMYQLLKSALRQRPEYLLVGEVRGDEAKTLFQAMATGHATYSTLHADSVMSAVYRLENRPISVPRMMLQTLDAISIQLQTRRDGRLVRRVKDLTEIVGIHPESGDLITNRVFEWDPATDTHEYLGSTHILDRIMERRNLGRDEVEQEWTRRSQVLSWMAHEGIRHIDEVSRVVQAYYRDPETVHERAVHAMMEAGVQPETAVPTLRRG